MIQVRLPVDKKLEDYEYNIIPIYKLGISDIFIYKKTLFMVISDVKGWSWEYKDVLAVSEGKIYTIDIATKVHVPREIELNIERI